MKKLLFGLIMALVLVGCSAAPADETPAEVTDASINITITANPSGFHPLKTNDVASSNVASQIFETLYVRTMDGTGFTPLLAKDFPVCSKDGLTCTISLVEGVKFHDGTDFTADDVKSTIESIQDPDYGSKRASIASSIEAVTVVDDYTVELKLLYPDGVLIAKLAHTNSAIVPTEADRDTDLMVAPVGTGPYKFVSYTSGSDVQLTRNDDYWGETSNIKDVTISIVTDISTAVARLETGETDFIADVPVEQIARIEAMGTATVTAKEAGGITYLGFRTTSAKNEIVYNVEVRKAIAMAIDRQAWIDGAMDGYARFSQSVIGPKILGYTDAAESFGYTFDPEAAAALVAELGCGDEEITLLTRTNAPFIPMAEMIQDNLKDVGFTNVQIVAEEFATYLDTSTKDNAFDMILLTWANVTGDGSELLEPNFTSSGSNRVRYMNEDFNALVAESKNTIDTSARIAALEAANEMILADAAVVPMYHTYLIYANSNRLTNVELDPGGLFSVNKFSVTE